MYQEFAFSASQRTLMIAFQWASTGSQLIIYRANNILSLVQHDGSYCQSTWDATHVSLLVTCFRKHWFCKGQIPLIHQHESLLEVSHTELFSILFKNVLSWLNSKKLLWELSHRSQLLILHWKWLNYLRFSIPEIVMHLSTSYMCMTHSTMIAIVLPLTLL